MTGTKSATASHELLPHDARVASGNVPPVAWHRSPLDRGDLAVLAATWLTSVAVLTAVGFAIVTWWEESSFGRADASINEWFDRRRTPTWTSVADFGSAFSDTQTVVIVGVVSLPLFAWLFRRWHDYVLLFVGLLLEVTSFVVVSMLVGRDRPPVEQLDGAPTNSFPSGHIAASVALYGGLAVVVFVQTRDRRARAAGLTVGVGVPLVVIASRIYLGMHYLTDAIAGVALGVVILAVMHRVVFGDDGAHPERENHR